MHKPVLSALVALSLAACSGPAVITSGSDEGGESTAAPVDLPGTVTSSAVVHYEEADGTGNGYAQSITYDALHDTFAVDNLAFDGANTYTRSTAMRNIGTATPETGPFAVYEGPSSFPDSVTGTPIPQFLHRAIYAQSASGETQFAIVRTGSYAGYGFGGFVYRRDGRVVLPTTGQARYSGAYAGLVDFDGSGGLLYSSGDMAMAIDFSDFNAADAVRGQVTNRAYYDMDGNEVTDTYLAALNNDLNLPAGTYTELPTLLFAVGPGAIDSNGEIGGSLASEVVDAQGTVLDHETGTFYGVISGDGTAGTDEVVGVIVVTATAPGSNGSVTQRETGGFILYR